MRYKANALGTAIVLMCAVHAASAAEIAGFSSTAVPANSDVYASVPFVRKATHAFTVTGTTANAVAVSGGLTTNQFAAQFYVRFTSGAAVGRWSTVSSNDATQLVLADTSFLSSVVATDTFEVFPHHTIASVFSDDLENISFRRATVPSTRVTEILIPSSNAGINVAPNETYFYFNSKWRKVGQSVAIDAGNAILPPQGHFVIRNNSTFVLRFIAKGETYGATQATTLPISSVQNDLDLSTGQAVPQRLIELNLGGTSAFVTTTNPGSIQDRLLVFDNSATGKNKAPVVTYFFFNSGWRKVGSPIATNFGGDVLPAGSHLVIRKVAGVAGTSANWSQPSPF